MNLPLSLVKACVYCRERVSLQHFLFVCTFRARETTAGAAMQKLIDHSLNEKMWRTINDDDDDTISCLQKLFQGSAIPDIENQNNPHGDTALTFTAWNGDNMKLVQLLLQYGANIDAKNKYDSTALIYAVRHNWKNLPQFLIDNGATSTYKIAGVTQHSCMQL